MRILCLRFLPCTSSECLDWTQITGMRGEDAIRKKPPLTSPGTKAMGARMVAGLYGLRSIWFGFKGRTLGANQLSPFL
jgi:hypothetical protein